MNPFSKFLRQWSKNSDLEAFVSYWDRLEFVMVQVHRRKTAVSDAEAEFAEVWGWLRQHYGEWEGELRPFWQQIKAASELTKTDPFQMLLDIQTPTNILGNWIAMQHLPASREALNQFTLSQS